MTGYNDLHQYIIFPTHINVNSLDLMFTPSDNPFQFVSSCIHSDLLNNHYLKHSLLLLEKSLSNKYLIYYRELRNQNYIELEFRILYNLSNTNQSFDSLNGCISYFLDLLASRHFLH